MKAIFNYLNPINHLGDKKYSFLFPFLITVGTAFLLEIYINVIVKDPNAVGIYAITFFFVLIIYSSFRDGIKGGITASIVTVIYYLYIIYSRHYTGPRLTSGLETTFVFLLIYGLLAFIIGWLKQTIDSLIERESNEKRRLQIILEQLPVGAIITDEKGVVVMANKKLDSILATKFPLGFQIGTKTLFDSRANNKKVIPSKGPLAQIISGEKKSVEGEYTILRSDEKKAYLVVRASAIFNKDNKFMAAVAIINDITHRKEIELRKDDFVNMASHELKTPITSMKLYLQSLEKRITNTKDSKSKVILNHIHEQTNRLQHLVNDLLDVSRLQTGKLSFNKEVFRLDVLIQETIELMDGSHSNHSIIFQTKSPVEIKADKFRIYQVITNLLNNAIKYSKKHTEILINLSTKKNKVIITITDFGIGIAEDQQTKIFDRMYQVVDDKTNTFPGFGMGLYIAKEIITRHKGIISVTSELGKGSTFSIELPVKT